MSDKPFFNLRIGERTLELLENFDVIATIQHVALIGRGKYLESLRENVSAAVTAATLGLSSIDYAKRRYSRSRDNPQEDELGRMAYIDAYYSAKAYVERMRAKLNTDNRPEPSLGVFGASLVLERLPASFFCAHFLYQTGHRYEGHAVSRLILEQLAWAYAASNLNDLDQIEMVSPTKSIAQLKKFTDKAGLMYGFLSKKTHIDYQSHTEFLQVENHKNMVIHSQSEFDEYGLVILHLADIFGLVWEASQYVYIANIEAIQLTGSGIVPNNTRPFLKDIQHHMSAIENAS